MFLLADPRVTYAESAETSLLCNEQTLIDYRVRDRIIMGKVLRVKTMAKQSDLFFKSLQR